MPISRWITAAADAALSTAALLALLVASLLVALLSAQDTRGRLAIEIGLSDEAAAIMPSCFFFAPEFDVAITAHAARLASTSQ